jgi:hypothetical protein
VRGLREAFQGDAAEVAVFEQIADQPPGSWVDDHGVGFGKGLQSRGEIGGLPGNIPFLCLTDTGKAAGNNQASSNADTNLQSLGNLEVTDGLDLSQASAHCALGIIFMGLWIAEISQDAITHVSRDKAIVPTDRLSGALLVRTQNIAQILGIEARRECSRVNNVAEHDRDLPPLRSGHPFVRCRVPRAILAT